MVHNIEKALVYANIFTQADIVSFETLLNGYFNNNSSNVLKEIYMKNEGISSIQTVLERMNYSVNSPINTKSDIADVQRLAVETFATERNLAQLKEQVITNPQILGLTADSCPGMEALTQAIENVEQKYTNGNTMQKVA